VERLAQVPIVLQVAVGFVTEPIFVTKLLDSVTRFLYLEWGGRV
jgi:hypothetical protein